MSSDAMDMVEPKREAREEPKKKPIKTIAALVIIVAITAVVISLSTIQVYNYLEKHNGVILCYFGTGDSCAVEVLKNSSMYELVTVDGESMIPTLTATSTAIAEHINVYGINNVAVGDIIIFLRDGVLVCHRVIVINDDQTFTVKGDNNQLADGQHVSFADVRGVITAIILK